MPPDSAEFSDWAAEALAGFDSRPMISSEARNVAA
jgi:hypothetical protein